MTMSHLNNTTQWCFLEMREVHAVQRFICEDYLGKWDIYFIACRMIHFYLRNGNILVSQTIIFHIFALAPSYKGFLARADMKQQPQQLLIYMER